jgi:hypothetical protein
MDNLEEHKVFDFSVRRVSRIRDQPSRITFLRNVGSLLQGYTATHSSHSFPLELQVTNKFLLRAMDNVGPYSLYLVFLHLLLKGKRNDDGEISLTI